MYISKATGNIHTIYVSNCHSISQDALSNQYEAYPQMLTFGCDHYGDVIMGAMAFQITSLAIVYSTIYSGADQRKHQSSVSLAFVRVFTGDQWIPHKRPVTRKMFPFDDLIMLNGDSYLGSDMYMLIVTGSYPIRSCENVAYTCTLIYKQYCLANILPVAT